MKYRKKPVVIEATQWWTNGDHPNDHLPPDDKIVAGERTEGAVVRYFRHPPVDPTTGEVSAADDAILLGDRKHSETPERFRRDTCVYTMHEHGWIDTLEGGHIVCPGDWVITGVQGEHYPCKPDIFTATYQSVDSAPAGIRVYTAPDGVVLKYARADGWDRDPDNSLAITSPSADGRDREEVALFPAGSWVRVEDIAFDDDGPVDAEDLRTRIRDLETELGRVADRSYRDTISRLIGLFHGKAEGMQMLRAVGDAGHKISLSDVVRAVQMHIPGNTLGAPDGYVPPPPPSPAEAAAITAAAAADRMGKDGAL